MLYWSVMNRATLSTGILILGLLFAGSAFGFGELGGACEPDCSKCHQISREEASGIVKKLNPALEVLEVGPAPVRGLWEMVIHSGNRKGVAYMDFSKRYIIDGFIVEIATKDNVTGRRIYEINKVALSEIPLGDALVMGKPDALRKVVVFDDPE